jgi:hypothetical protein
MSDIHIIKLTESEAVVKVYETISNGATVDLSVENLLTRSTEVFQTGVSAVSIKAIYWGTKPNKQINVQRKDNGGYEGDYYLVNSGFYDYRTSGFVDNAYHHGDFRITGDGPFHIILVLGKNGWAQKVETAAYSIYDNTNSVGS